MNRLLVFLTLLFELRTSNFELPVPPDLAGRVSYMLHFMPWGVVGFLFACCAAGILYSFFAQSTIDNRKSTIVACGCGRRSAELIGCGDRVSVAVQTTINQTCPWCTPNQNRDRHGAALFVNRQSEIDNRQLSRRDT